MKKSELEQFISKLDRRLPFRMLQLKTYEWSGDENSDAARLRLEIKALQEAIATLEVVKQTLGR